MDRCYTHKGQHIPGCFGCAAHGHDHCTCHPTPPKLRHPLADARKHLHRIERELALLRKAIEAIAEAHDEQTTPNH